jgi:hypothetical protein
MDMGDDLEGHKQHGGPRFIVAEENFWSMK